MYKYYKPMSQKTIYQQYLLKSKSKHKDIYGLYLYYCYLLKVFPKEYSKQNLSASIRADIKKLDQISEETRYMVNNKIETLEELLSFKEQNSIELQELVSNRANLWRKYKRAKTEDDKVKIYNEIEGLQPQIKELYNNRRYCDGIYKRSIDIRNNIENFDKEINLPSEKDMIKASVKF